MKPFVKFSAKATDISQIPCLVFEALHHSISGRPGGCYLDIPSDVLHQTISESDLSKLLSEAENSISQQSPGEKPLDIEKAVSLLRSAERPLIVFGKGVAFVCAENSLKKLVDNTGIPFLPTLIGKVLLPDTHELAATAARSLAIGKCDVTLIVNARLNWLLYFCELPRWSKDVKFIGLRKPYLV